MMPPIDSWRWRTGSNARPGRRCSSSALGAAQRARWVDGTKLAARDGAHSCRRRLRRIFGGQAQIRGFQSLCWPDFRDVSRSFPVLALYSVCARSRGCILVARATSVSAERDEGWLHLVVRIA